ncbi:MAG: HAMP domain-containing sensor histidine kinase [Anaerolineales bacterium]
MDKKEIESPPSKKSEIQDVSDKMKELDELKNTFIALVSHELRTPLNLLNGYLVLGIEELDNNPKKAREYFTLVENNTKKIMRVVQELTDFTRLQLGKEITYLNPIPIEDAFFQTFDLLKPNLANKNINLVADFPENVRQLRFDGDSLIILFRNLISNAAKFSEQDGKVLVVGKILEDQLSLTFHDWASPIPENKKETIFEDFRQLENYLTRRYEGMGLGLAVARRTARFLGGNILLEVREDGNTFEIILPVEIPESKE